MDQERVRQLAGVVLGAAGDFVGKAELLAQVDHLEASGSPSWVNLTVRLGPPASPVRDNPIPGACWAYDEAGRPIGILVLWTKDRWLSDFEVGWVTDEPPTALPDPALVHH
jgi:hypothetical protein